MKFYENIVVYTLPWISKYRILRKKGIMLNVLIWVAHMSARRAVIEQNSLLSKI